MKHWTCIACYRTPDDCARLAATKQREEGASTRLSIIKKTSECALSSRTILRRHSDCVHQHASQSHSPLPRHISHREANAITWTTRYKRERDFRYNARRARSGTMHAARKQLIPASSPLVIELNVAVPVQRRIVSLLRQSAIHISFLCVRMSRLNIRRNTSHCDCILLLGRQRLQPRV